MSERVSSRDRFKMSASVFMLFLQGNELLFLLRDDTGWMDGHHSLPGGVLEEGETLVEAVIREAREETGLSVLPADVMLVHMMHNLTTDQEWLGAFFMAKKWSGVPELKEPQKHEAIGWLNINDLPENISPYIRQAIEGWREGMFFSAFGWDIPNGAPEEAYDHKHVKKKN